MRQISDRVILRDNRSQTITVVGHEKRELRSKAPRADKPSPIRLFGALLLAAGGVSPAAGSVFLDASAPGNRAIVATPYGDSIYMVRPGTNINPAFKVEDGKANWSKDNLTGFNASADMVPIAIHQAPVAILNGVPFLAIGVDFNETGGTPNFDVVNLMLWTAPESVNTLQAASVKDPSVSSLTWAPSVKAQTISTWESGIREMASSNIGEQLGLNLVYQQNADPLLNVPGDSLPYGSDAQRVYSSGLGTLGSNEVDIAVFVPFSVLAGRNTSDYLYLGMQTGALCDGGSDRVGFIDPSSILSNGYLATNGFQVSTTYTQPNSIVVPETGLFALPCVSAVGVLFRRTRGPAQPGPDRML